MTSQPTLPFDESPNKVPQTLAKMLDEDIKKALHDWELEYWYGPQTAQEAKAEAIERVGAHANPDWKAAALDVVRNLAATQATFTTDDVWARCSAGTHEPRAMGAIMQAAARAGWCRATGVYVQSQRVACHARPLRVWQSLIYRGATP